MPTSGIKKAVDESGKKSLSLFSQRWANGRKIINKIKMALKDTKPEILRLFFKINLGEYCLVMRLEAMSLLVERFKEKPAKLRKKTTVGKAKI